MSQPPILSQYNGDTGSWNVFTSKAAIVIVIEANQRFSARVECPGQCETRFDCDGFFSWRKGVLRAPRIATTIRSSRAARSRPSTIRSRGDARPRTR